MVMKQVKYLMITGAYSVKIGSSQPEGLDICLSFVDRCHQNARCLSGIFQESKKVSYQYEFEIIALVVIDEYCNVSNICKIDISTCFDTINIREDDIVKIQKA